MLSDLGTSITLKLMHELTSLLEIITVESDFVISMQDAMLEKFQENKQSINGSSQPYRGFYNQKHQRNRNSSFLLSTF